MTRRDDLVDQLHETLETLVQFCKDEGQGRDWGIVLVTSINMHADEDTLQRINDDLRDFMAKAAVQPR